MSHSTIKDKLSAQLRRDEGDVLHVYDDATGEPIVKGSKVAGYPTVGVGVLLDKEKGGGLMQEESEFILNNRIKIIERTLSARLPWVARLDEARQGVLVNMAFNLGVSGLLGFRKTLALVKAGDYARASVEMLDSKWARQVKGRATRLSEQMRTGKWV